MLAGFFPTHNPHSFMSVFPRLHKWILWFDLVLASSFSAKRNTYKIFLLDEFPVLGSVLLSCMGCHFVFFLDFCSRYFEHDYMISPITSLHFFPKDVGVVKIHYWMGMTMAILVDHYVEYNYFGYVSLGCFLLF